MYSYTTRTRASDLTRFNYTLKSADDEVRVDTSVKTKVIRRSNRDTADARRLTLDDFGGRSDALGG